jgi:hypothetical protein
MTVGYKFSAPNAISPSSLLSDNVDPQSGDLCSFSRGVDPVDAAVLYALMVNRGSGPAVTDVGQRFALVKKMDESAQRTFEGYAREALSRLVAAGDIEILSMRWINFLPSQQIGELEINYKNLRAFDSATRTTTIKTAGRNE